MSSKIKTQIVDRAFFANFLKKAKECRRAAETSISHNDWNAATICAIHGCVSASDALCAYFLGKRACGERHSDASSLLRMIAPEDERFKKNALRLTRVLGIKSMAEYEERLVFRAEAEKALQDCRRFIKFAEEILSKTGR